MCLYVSIFIYNTYVLYVYYMYIITFEIDL